MINNNNGPAGDVFSREEEAKGACCLLIFVAAH